MRGISPGRRAGGGMRGFSPGRRGGGGRMRGLSPGRRGGGGRMRPLSPARHHHGRHRRWPWRRRWPYYPVNYYYLNSFPYYDTYPYYDSYNYDPYGYCQCDLAGNVAVDSCNNNGIPRCYSSPGSPAKCSCYRPDLNTMGCFGITGATC